LYQVFHHNLLKGRLFGRASKLSNMVVIDLRFTQVFGSLFPDCSFE
jgi:hypothetical protein